MIPPDLPDLARIVADWAAPATGAKIFIFGSRVRGDHTPGSDVDIYIHYRVDGKIDAATATWHGRQQSSSYADLLPLLPGPLGEKGRETLCPDDLETVGRILAGPVVHKDRSVRCVHLPPKPSA